jgi:hypothetical protein
VQFGKGAIVAVRVALHRLVRLGPGERVGLEMGSADLLDHRQRLHRAGWHGSRSGYA